MDRSTFPLRILPLESLRIITVLPQRAVQEVAREIETSGCLRNPVAVSSLESGEYCVLDGGVRTAALEELGARDVITQIIDPCDPSVSIRSSRHLLDSDSMKLLRETAARMGLSIRKGEEHSASDGGSSLDVSFGDGERFEIPLGNGGIVEPNRLLRELVMAYSDQKQPHRIGLGDDEGRSGMNIAGSRGNVVACDNRSLAMQGSVLLTFPNYGYRELKHLTSLNEKIPPYLLDVSFPRRYLGVNLALKILTDDVSIAVKNDFLDQLLRMRLSSCRTAFYSQSVIMMNG